MTDEALGLIREALDGIVSILEVLAVNEPLEDELRDIEDIINLLRDITG